MIGLPSMDGLSDDDRKIGIGRRSFLDGVGHLSPSRSKKEHEMTIFILHDLLCNPLEKGADREIDPMLDEKRPKELAIDLP